MSRIVKIFLFVLIVVVIFESCGIYSFTGASLHPDDKTVSVKYFPNRAPLVNPTLSQNFTEKLKDRFMAQTSLELTDIDGDLNFEGEITGYSTAPIAITQGQKSEMTRLTISLKVRYKSVNNPDSNFEKQFSRYADFDKSMTLTDAESGGTTEEIIEQLIDDIFNESVVNW